MEKYIGYFRPLRNHKVVHKRAKWSHPKRRLTSLADQWRRVFYKRVWHIFSPVASSLEGNKVNAVVSLRLRLYHNVKWIWGLESAVCLTARAEMFPSALELREQSKWQDGDIVRCPSAWIHARSSNCVWYITADRSKFCCPSLFIRKVRWEVRGHWCVCELCVCVWEGDVSNVPLNTARPVGVWVCCDSCI